MRTGAVATRGFYAACVLGAFALVAVIALYRPLRSDRPARRWCRPSPRCAVCSAGPRAVTSSPPSSARGCSSSRSAPCWLSGSRCERPVRPVGARAEELPEEGSTKALGALEDRRRGPHPATTASRALGPMASAVALGERPELVVELRPPRRGPASRARRGGPTTGACVPVPAVRSEAARPAAVLARREARSAWSALRWAKSGPASQVSTNSGTAASPPRLELGGEPFVSARRRRSLCLVDDARVRPDDDEALDEPRGLECQVQATPAAERVADVARLAARLAEGARRRVRARSPGRGAESGRVRGDRVSRPRSQPSSSLADACPGGARLGEPVDEDDPRSVPPCRRVQRGRSLPRRLAVLEGHRR